MKLIFFYETAIRQLKIFKIMSISIEFTENRKIILKYFFRFTDDYKKIYSSKLNNSDTSIFKIFANW